MDIYITNGLCLAILAVVYLGMRLQPDVTGKPAKSFILLVISAFSYVLFNLLCEILDGKPRYMIWIFIVNVLVFVAVDVTMFSFARYLDAILGEYQEKHTFFIHMAEVSCFARIALTVVLAVSGNLFTLPNGWYHEEPMCLITYVFSFLIMLELLIAILQNRRRFAPRHFAVVLIYMLLPIPQILVEMLLENYTLTVASTVISIIMIYVLIQASAIEEGETRARALQDIADTDFLTGLGNRRAYNKFIKGCKAEEDVGFIFCDLNHLREINNGQGHTAGDQYIRRFAAILTDMFPQKTVFRISGDEFVVLMFRVSESTFFQHVEELREECAQNHSISAVGGAFGRMKNLSALFIEAEKRMYEDKIKNRAGASCE